jgi:hypothetical protein
MGVKNRIDCELNLLKPVGDQGLFSEDWTKNTYNDNRMFRASGEATEPEFSNFSALFIYEQVTKQYTRSSCKADCKTLFSKGDEKTLREACKQKCKSNCKVTGTCKYKPTRKDVCIGRGLTADCKEKIEVEAIENEKKSQAQYAESFGVSESVRDITSGGKMSTGAKVGVVLGIVLVLGGIGYVVLKKK